MGFRMCVAIRPPATRPGSMQHSQVGRNLIDPARTFKFAEDLKP